MAPLAKKQAEQNPSEINDIAIHDPNPSRLYSQPDVSIRLNNSRAKEYVIEEVSSSKE